MPRARWARCSYPWIHASTLYDYSVTQDCCKGGRLRCVNLGRLAAGLGALAAWQGRSDTANSGTRRLDLPGRPGTCQCDHRLGCSGRRCRGARGAGSARTGLGPRRDVRRGELNRPALPAFLWSARIAEDDVAGSRSRTTPSLLTEEIL